MTEEQEPSIGRIVHFRLDVGPNKGETRPAIVVRVHAPSQRVPGLRPTHGSHIQPDSLLNLQVLTDGVNDKLGLVEWRTSVRFGTKNGEWCWPVRSTPHGA